MIEEKPPAPLLFDAKPRYQEFTVPPDLGETPLIHALLMLRPMVHARGYNNRPVELDDVILVCSERWKQRAEELKEKYPKMQLHFVPAPLLKTMGAWGITFGLDTVASLPNW